MTEEATANVAVELAEVHDATDEHATPVCAATPDSCSTGTKSDHAVLSQVE